MLATQTPVVISSRYQVIDKLGTGGMGVVYRVQDRLTGQTVALKQVLVSSRQMRFASKSDSSESALLLAQEFKFLASLRHPHIISVLDYGFDNNSQPYYTMTLIEGAQEVTAVASNRDLDGKIALLLQMLQALAYLHRQGILHRDLKPANVLVDAEQQVKVVDFGLAVAANQENTSAGTLAYMAPELLKGQSAVVQSDLYAVGVMAYELFAGQRPFASENALAMMVQALYEPLNIQPLAVSPALIAVLQRLLAPNIDDRYASAEEVMQAFADATDHPLSFETQATRESFLQAAQFVGRDAELKLLNDALAYATNNSGSVWLVGGESGVGKSRLLDELQTQALLEGALVLRGQAVAEGGTPYRIWREAIRRLVLQTELTDYEASVLKPMLPDIGRLLGREVADPPQVDAQSLQLRLWGVIELIFSQKQLTVLLLEDLQWADESLIFLNWLLELTKRSPLLIVGTYRDDERPHLPAEFPGAQHIKLARLSTESIAHLSESMLGEGGKSEKVLNLLEQETEGNVYFIIEVLRTLAEEAGGLANVGRKSLPKQVFAGGMQTVIQRRLDKVPESARRLMTIAAVVGRELNLKILKAMSPGLNIDNWLQQVATVIDVQDNRYRFAHDKLREAILNALEEKDCRSIHADIAQTIEAVYPDSPQQYGSLAYHWGQAQNPAKTIHNATLAGELALRSGSYGEAIKFFQNALAFTDQVQMDNQQLGNLHYLLGDAQWGQSDTLRSREWHVKALHYLGFTVPETPRELGIHTLKPLLSHLRGRIFHRQRPAANSESLLIAAKSFHQIMQGSYHDANLALGLYCIFSGMDAAERAGDSPEARLLQARYYGSLGFATGDVSIYRVSRFYMKLAANLRKTETDLETLAWLDLFTGVSLIPHGQWDEGNRLIGRAIDLSKSAGSLRLWVQLHEFQVGICYLQSRFTEALEAIENAGQVAIRDEHIQALSIFQLAQAQLLFIQGKISEAGVYYLAHKSAIEDSLTYGDQTISRIMVHSLETNLYSFAQEWESALKSAETLNAQLTKAQTISFMLAAEASTSIALYLTLWEKQQSPAYKQLAETMLNLYHRKYTRHYEIGQPVEYTYRCWYYWLSGDEKQAKTFGAQAIQAAQTYKMPYYEAIAYYHLARFMGRNDPDRADHLKKAMALFEQIGAAHDLESARAAL